MHVRATSDYVTQDVPFDTSEIARSNKIEPRALRCLARARNA